MKSIVTACLMFCVACGGKPLLQSGTYNVDVTYTRDDWPMSMTGQTTQAVWNVAEDNDEYVLDVVSGSQDLLGKKVNQQIVFEKDQLQTTSGCENGQTFLLQLDPNSDGDAFTGYGKITVSFGTWGGNIIGCDGIIWLITEVAVDGKQD